MAMNDAVSRYKQETHDGFEDEEIKEITHQAKVTKSQTTYSRRQDKIEERNTLAAQGFEASDEA
jgi:hypothetical protein